MSTEVRVLLIQHFQDDVLNLVPPPNYSEEVDPLNGFEQIPEAPADRSSEASPQPTQKPIESTTLSVVHRRAMERTGDGPFSTSDDDFEDETLLERIVGLSEMFPETVREKAFRMFSMSFSGLKSVYGLSRSISWFLASTATLCFLPLFLELERVQTEEQEAVHQRTMMLGPKAATTGSHLAGFSAVPHLTPM